MSFIEDTLTLDIEDVDDFVRVWIKNDKTKSLKVLKDFDAEYHNGVHGFSNGVFSKDLIEGENYIVVGVFNKVFNGNVKLISLPFVLKGGKTSYALSFLLNQKVIWSTFKFRSDHSLIENNEEKRKSLFSSLSHYFGARTKEEEDAIVGIRYLHIFKINIKNKKVTFLEVYNEEFISNDKENKKMKLNSLDGRTLGSIYKKIMEFNSEFIVKKRYAEGSEPLVKKEEK